MVLNDTHLQAYAKDLAGRQTLQGQPGDTYQKASCTLALLASTLCRQARSACWQVVLTLQLLLPATSHLAQSPVGSVSASGGTVTNIDYRTATIPVAASASYNVGDRVTFANGGVTVKAVGRDDKTVTDEAMTFVIVSKPSGTSIEVWPKPIAFDDPALSTLDKAYANINTRILNAATVDRVNVDTSTQPSIAWQKDSIEVLAGEMPMEKLGEWGGMKVAKSAYLTAWLCTCSMTPTLLACKPDGVCSFGTALITSVQWITAF